MEVMSHPIKVEDGDVAWLIRHRTSAIGMTRPTGRQGAMAGESRPGQDHRGVPGALVVRSPRWSTGLVEADLCASAPQAPSSVEAGSPSDWEARARRPRATISPPEDTPWVGEMRFRKRASALMHVDGARAPLSAVSVTTADHLRPDRHRRTADDRPLPARAGATRGGLGPAMANRRERPWPRGSSLAPPRHPSRPFAGG